MPNPVIAVRKWSERRLRLQTFKEHSGAMVALMLDESDSAALLSALPPGLEPETNLHITLAYLGDAASLTRQQSDDIDRILADVGSYSDPVTGTVQGIGYFNQDEAGQRVLWAAFDAPNLPDLRQSVVKGLEAYGLPVDDAHGFTPHITLAYCPNGDQPVVPDLPMLKITFPAVTRMFAGDRADFPLEPSTGFIVKEVNGRHRWVLISSSAYEDRDGEIVSQKALQADVDRADTDGDFGPLRWWHIPGAEIGDCDFNMLHGRLLYESGTFRDERMAQAVKEHAAELGASIGFQHPIGQPDADGVFHAIRRFERSLLPREKASNPFTAVSFVEKEAQMTSIEDKLKAFGKVLNGDAEMVAQVLAIGATKEAEATAAGTRTKEKKECEPGYHWDEATQACVKDKPDDAPPPPAVEKKEYVGDMDPAALKALIGDAVTGQMATLKDELQTALDAQTATKAQHDEATAVALKAYETKLDGIAASATAAGTAATEALKGVQELKGELPRALGERLKGWRASEKGDEPPAELKGQEPTPDPMEKHWKAIQATAGIHAPAA